MPTCYPILFLFIGYGGQGGHFVLGYYSVPTCYPVLFFFIGYGGQRGHVVQRYYPCPPVIQCCSFSLATVARMATCLAIFVCAHLLSNSVPLHLLQWPAWPPCLVLHTWPSPRHSSGQSLYRWGSRSICPRDSPTRIGSSLRIETAKILIHFFEKYSSLVLL